MRWSRFSNRQGQAAENRPPERRSLPTGSRTGAIRGVSDWAILRGEGWSRSLLFRLILEHQFALEDERPGDDDGIALGKS